MLNIDYFFLIKWIIFSYTNTSPVDSRIYKLIVEFTCTDNTGSRALL